MTIYETVKATVTVSRAAERYGLQVGRNSMICCPFHNDTNPSMKLNDDYFYCFGCGKHGDVIDLTAKLFGLIGRKNPGTILNERKRYSMDGIETKKSSLYFVISRKASRHFCFLGMFVGNRHKIAKRTFPHQRHVP